MSRKQKRHHNSTSESADRPRDSVIQSAAPDEESKSSKKADDQEPQQPPSGVKICDFVLEMSLFGLLCIALLSKSPLSTGEYTIVAGSLPILIVLLFTRRLDIIRSPLGILGLSFFFMFVFTIAKQTSIRYELPSHSIMLIPISTIVLSAGLISWIFKIAVQPAVHAGSAAEEKSPSQVVVGVHNMEIVHPYSFAAGFLIVFSLGLFIALQGIYQLESKALMEIIHLIVALFLLVALISFNITKETQVKSITIYVIVACLGILVKGALFSQPSP